MSDPSDKNDNDGGRDAYEFVAFVVWYITMVSNSQKEIFVLCICLHLNIPSHLLL
jgi:hypothetical protein